MVDLLTVPKLPETLVSAADRLAARRRLQNPAADGLPKQGVVLLRLVRVRHREARNRAVQPVGGAAVTRDGGGVAGPGMGLCKDLARDEGKTDERRARE